MRPRYRLSTAIVPLLFALVAHAAGADEARLVVLHTTDLHGALTGWDYLEDRPAARGLTRIAPLVRAIRGEGAPVLLLDAGDAIQGGPLVDVDRPGGPARPEPMTAAMNRLGYDAMAIGNHEFSHGLIALESARAASGFPWLAANVVRAADRRPAFPASRVRTFGGLRVGVVGVTTPAIPMLEDSAHVAGLRFLSPVEAANAEIARLRDSVHCDVVVLLAHTGLERDPVTGAERAGDAPDENWGHRLATEVRGADVLVLGHTHAVVASATVGGTLVTQAGHAGESLGRVDVTLTRAAPDSAWRIASRSARVIALADTSAEDSALVAFAKPYHDETREALDRVIGEAAVDHAAPRGRLAPSPPWALLHRVMLEASGADVSLVALPDASVRIPKGPVRVRDVMRLYPYDNTVVTIELTGAELKATLERSAAYFADYRFAEGRPLESGALPAWNFDTAEGVSYVVDLTRPAGERILDLTLRGAPLDPARRLKVAVTSYRANGGGGFEAVRRAPRLARSREGIRDLLVAAIQRSRTLHGAWRNGWHVRPAYAASPARPLVDLLVRRDVLAREAAVALAADSSAGRAEALAWIARAFGWRERRVSRAFAAAPDSVAPWLEGLRRRGVLGPRDTWERLEPRAPVTPAALAGWCEAAARRAGWALARPEDLGSFRRSLWTSTGIAGAEDGAALTRAQALGAIANARYPRLRVLETTDFHGAILGGARERRSQRPIGGSPVMAAYVERLRAENPEGTVLLDGGDCFQGTMISNLQFGRPVVEQMNALRYAAVAIGNHEFDWTADTLWARVDEMRFAALAANAIEKRTGRRPRGARSDTVFVRRGVRVGVFGLAYRFTPVVTLPRHVAHLRFEDDSLWAARLAPRLRSRATVVLGVGHVPAESDSARRARGGDLARLARGVRGVDAWFGGHSHNLVLDEIGGSPVLIAGALGEAVGVCDLVVDPLAGRVIEHHARLEITYADAVVPDSAWLARVERWNAAVAPYAATPVGRNARHLTRSRGGESTVGDLVCDAMRAAAGADVALQNSGGLRADLAAGVVTKGQVYEVMPFDNTMVSVTLTGAELRRALEEALRFDRVTQVSGIRYVFDPDLPEGRRVVSVSLPDGAPLDEARDYRVVCNNFMASGGDNYETLAKGRDRLDEGLLVRDALERWVVERSAGGGSVDVQPDGRVRRVGGR
jgi:2',3'-cyclic-nucleotide 2'-phosphodiesterase/3'-nucleotidase